MLGRDQLARYGRFASCEDRDINFARQLADNTCIFLRQWQGDIARDGRDSKDVDLVRTAKREQDRGRIVLSGVCVDDDVSCCQNGAPVRVCAICASLRGLSMGQTHKSPHGGGPSLVI